MSERELLDRPMPQSPDAERAVLGAIMWPDTRAIRRVADTLQLVPVDFFKDAHRTIYQACLAVDNDGAYPDILAVTSYLAERGELAAVGGVAYVSSLTEAPPDVANVERYVAIVKRKAKFRDLARLGADLTERAMTCNGDPEAIADDVVERAQLVRPDDAIAAVLNGEKIAREVGELWEAGGVQRGASTGFPSLDENYTVARASTTVINGIPSHGKSGFVDHVCINLARLHKWQVLMFSAENAPTSAHVKTLIEKYVGEPFNEGPTARMSREQKNAGLAFLDRHFRFIDPAAEGMTVDRILAIATALSESRRIDALVIDPWNELTHEWRNGLKETDYISVALSKIRRWARRHDAHVFIVAHPAKMEKNRAGLYDVPTPYDLSGSAHFRNKADYCLCVYRDLAADDPAVAIHIQKVRRREIGRIGQVILNYNRVTGEYLDPKAPRRRWEAA